MLKAGGLFVYADDLDALKFETGERYLLELGFEMSLVRDISEHAFAGKRFGQRQPSGSAGRCSREGGRRMGDHGRSRNSDLR
ncbi:hypothetical protein ACFTAO_23550 [Paenibacillus rhizoplanae]